MVSEISSVRDKIITLHPGYFALVMATGIVSIASNLFGFELIAWVLFYINVVAYGILWIMFLVRLTVYFQKIVDDISSHQRGPGFFTMIAGTNVLGSQFVIVAKNALGGIILWYLGLVLWIIVTYSFFTLIFLKETKPTVEKGISGAWLIIIVSTQSVSILGTMIAPDFGDLQNTVLFFCFSMFVTGGMFYIMVMGDIFFRFVYWKIEAEHMTPPYWINMGATAITTLAGATLMLNEDQWVWLHEMHFFLAGFTIFFWAYGTWWIPMLFIFGAWRHFYKKHPFIYDPLYWGMVFPMGMYTACTFQLSKALDIQFLMIIPELFIYVALTAWMFVFFGLIKRCIEVLTFPSKTPAVKVSEV